MSQNMPPQPPPANRPGMSTPPPPSMPPGASGAPKPQNAQPWFKRPVVIGIGAFLLGLVLGAGAMGSGEAEPPEPVEVTTTVTVTAPPPEPTETTEAPQTDSDIDENMAWTLCEQYGKSQFPYGFKVHWILGKIANEYTADGVLYMKYEVTVTNEFGAERSANMECHVSGSGKNLTIDNFLVYWAPLYVGAVWHTSRTWSSEVQPWR